MSVAVAIGVPVESATIINCTGAVIVHTIAEISRRWVYCVVVIIAVETVIDAAWCETSRYRQGAVISETVTVRVWPHPDITFIQQ